MVAVGDSSFFWEGDSIYLEPADESFCYQSNLMSRDVVRGLLGGNIVDFCNLS